MGRSPRPPAPHPPTAWQQRPVPGALSAGGAWLGPRSVGRRSRWGRRGARRPRGCVTSPPPSLGVTLRLEQRALNYQQDVYTQTAEPVFDWAAGSRGRVDRGWRPSCSPPVPPPLGLPFAGLPTLGSPPPNHVPSKERHSETSPEYPEASGLTGCPRGSRGPGGQRASPAWAPLSLTCYGS